MSNIEGRAPQGFLVRYDREVDAVWVGLRTDFVLDPSLDLSQLERVKRVADSYLFSVLETPEGALLAGHFVLRDSFFDLPVAPISLRTDMEWLAKASGHPDLAGIDLWWAACMGHSMLDPEREDAGDPDD